MPWKDGRKGRGAAEGRAGEPAADPWSVRQISGAGHDPHPGSPEPSGGVYRPDPEQGGLSGQIHEYRGNGLVPQGEPAVRPGPGGSRHPETAAGPDRGRPYGCHQPPCRRIDWAVASMGTAFTEHQAALLKRLTPEVVFCFDSDQA